MIITYPQHNKNTSLAVDSIINYNPLRFCLHAFKLTKEPRLLLRRSWLYAIVWNSVLTTATPDVKGRLFIIRFRFICQMAPSCVVQLHNMGRMKGWVGVGSWKL